MANAPWTPEALYAERSAECGARRDRYERLSSRNGNLNLALFLAALASLLVAAVWPSLAILYGVAGILGLGFLASLIHHSRVNRLVERYAALYAIDRESLARLRRAWKDLPAPGAVEGAVQGGLDPEAAADLDLLGYASLEQLLGTPETPVGQATLRRWILAPASPDIVRLRQGAAAELAHQVELRQEIALRGRLMGSAQAEYEAFISWAEGGGWLRRRPVLLWSARLLPLAVLGLGIAQALGLTTYPALLAALAVGGVLSLTVGQRVRRDLDRLTARQAVYQTYADLFRLVTEQPFESAGLRHLQARLSAGGLSADHQMGRLSRLMPLADIRRWMFFFPIEMATLWSFHVLWLFERWQAVAGDSVRGWLDALGEAESLMALAALSHDHPAWAWPEVLGHESPEGGHESSEGGHESLEREEGADLRLVAKRLAHPLLPPGRAVGNDVEVGPPGTFLLVTGSNMAGKSTLLRALGVNTVLAQMGGPVCADAMRLPPLTVACSMRVLDSLSQGVSSYMAQLQRLKTIVDMADDPARRGGRPLLYLLDEILQGTNTAERQIAARRIILHLTKTDAIGAVSTHDLTLAASPEVVAVAVAVHFTEDFVRGEDGPRMTFDYRLRPGIAASTNALKLMEIMGLPGEG